LLRNVKSAAKTKVVANTEATTIGVMRMCFMRVL
jgi:hypothetical protein